MKKIVIVLFSFLLLQMQAIAAPFNNLVFLGDSLTDNGNLYRAIFKLIPKSPPYYKGRFTNGPTWAEGVSKFYYDHEFMTAKNYAVGGATAVFHIPVGHFAAPTNLELEVSKYLVDTTFQDRSNTLFSIWIGANDYLFNPKLEVDEVTTRVTTKIAAELVRLIQNGGKYFIITNLPDLSKIPEIRPEYESKYHQFTLEHNKKLAIEIKQVIDAYPDVNILYLNVFDIFNDVMANPKKYNEKYHVNITNGTEACWKGSYLLKNDISKPSLIKEIKQTLRSQQGTIDSQVDYTAISTFIAENPIAAQAYRLEKIAEMGMKPCPNPEQYLFWDTIHPTAIVHNILAQIVVDFISVQLP